MLGKRCAHGCFSSTTINRIARIHRRPVVIPSAFTDNQQRQPLQQIGQQLVHFKCHPLPSSLRPCPTTRTAATTAAPLTEKPGKTSAGADAILLNANFALNEEWAERFKNLDKKKLGHDAYEWITQVQKKYSGGGKASAIDLDVACAIARYDDQLGDLVELSYKLRHKDNAADLFPSTEYNLYRLLLDHGHVEKALKMLNDPLNYGLFLNEHCCCLYLKHFLAGNDLQGATRIAIYVMHQELFSFSLLNFLAARSLLQFVEENVVAAPVPDDGPSLLSQLDMPYFRRRTPTLEQEISYTEENVKMFRYPWIKVPHNDGHFDLVETDQLVGKSLEWLSWHLKLADGSETMKKRNASLTSAIHLLGVLLQRKWAEAQGALEKMGKEVVHLEHSILAGALKIARPCLSRGEAPKEGNAEEKAAEEDGQNAQRREAVLDLLDQIADQAGAKKGAEPKLWPILVDAFRPIQAEEEHRMMEEQRRIFVEWEKRRMEFIESQAQRLELNLRLEEIGKRRKELVEENELLHFFENRPHWEDRALQRHLLEEQLGMLKKRGYLTEEEYGRSLFKMYQLMKEGKTAAQALEQIHPGAGPNVDVALKSREMKKK